MSNRAVIICCLVALVLVGYAAIVATTAVMSGAYPLEYMPNLSAEDIIDYKSRVDANWARRFKIVNTYAPYVFAGALWLLTWSLSKSRFPPIVLPALGVLLVLITQSEQIWLEMAKSDPETRLIQLARGQTLQKGNIAGLMLIAILEGWVQRKRPKPPPPPPPEKKGKKK